MSSIIGGATITFCTQTAHITNVCMKSGRRSGLCPPLTHTINLQVSLKHQTLWQRQQKLGIKVKDTKFCGFNHSAKKQKKSKNR